MAATLEMAGNASVASFGSSQGSSAGSHKGSRRYRTVAATSKADDLLFGDRNAHSAPRDRKLPFLETTSNKRSISGGAKSKQKNSKEPELIEVITKDMIRKLRVPREDPSGQTLILYNTEFQRIQKSSTVLSEEEREAQQDALKAEKQKRIKESEGRKLHMQNMELQRQKNEKLSDLEQEAKEKAQYLLQKAREQMEEQEDEIKKLNETILNAKCHAIRDAQLVEKIEIKKDILEEDKRLDEMMESDRLRALYASELRQKEKKLQRLGGATVLRDQISHKEDVRMLEEEKREQETKERLRYLEQLQEEDMSALHEKRESQRRVMEDVKITNEEITHNNDLKKQQEKLEAKRVARYLQEKAERELEQEQEKIREHRERENEIARLRAQQERAKDKQAEKDALRAKRRTEEAEREWRKKEKEDAAKKDDNERNLRVARSEQVQQKEHFQSVQANRDRSEFDRVLKEQMKDKQREEQVDQMKMRDAKDYANDVRSQIKDKEKDRVRGRQNFFEEGIKLDEEAKERRQKIDEIKRRKLQELKAAGVSDKYVNEVARRIEAPPPSLSNML